VLQRNSELKTIPLEERLRREAVRNEAFFEMERFTPDVTNADGPSIIKEEKPEPNNVIADLERPAKRPSPSQDFPH
jgi:hypothetical protein